MMYYEMQCGELDCTLSIWLDTNVYELVILQEMRGINTICEDVFISLKELIKCLIIRTRIKANMMKFSIVRPG